MSGHTPGPWVWGTETDSSTGLMSEHGEVISAEVYGNVGFVEVSAPDARLIAAAPQLLEALEATKDLESLCLRKHEADQAARLHGFNVETPRQVELRKRIKEIQNLREAAIAATEGE